jgi:hypothetical protein
MGTAAPADDVAAVASATAHTAAMMNETPIRFMGDPLFEGALTVTATHVDRARELFANCEGRPHLGDLVSLLDPSFIDPRLDCRAISFENPTALACGRHGTRRT